MTVNQCHVAGGEAEAMTAFVICSGLSSHCATVVTVIDRPRISIQSCSSSLLLLISISVAAARNVPSRMQLDWFVRGEICSIVHSSDIEPWTH